MNTKSEKAQKLESFYRLLTVGFINFPNDLVIEIGEMANSFTVSISSHADDHGKLIGANGCMFRALETMCKLYSARLGKNSHVSQLQPHCGERLPLTPFQQDQEWMQLRKAEKLKGLIEQICQMVFKLPAKVEVFETTEQTIYSVELDAAEQPALPLDKIDNDIEVIFHATGKAMGRRIFVDVSKACQKS